MAASKHILAINNEPDMLTLFTQLLEDEGYRVSTRRYAERDIDAIATLAPDLIVLDYMWPTEDAGWTLLQMLKASPRTTRIPIVLCTGAVREVDELAGRLAEMMVSVVLKPFDIEELLEKITTALNEASA